MRQSLDTTHKNTEVNKLMCQNKKKKGFQCPAKQRPAKAKNEMGSNPGLSLFLEPLLHLLLECDESSCHLFRLLGSLCSPCRQFVPLGVWSEESWDHIWGRSLCTHRRPNSKGQRRKHTLSWDVFLTQAMVELWMDSGGSLFAAIFTTKRFFFSIEVIRQSKLRLQCLENNNGRSRGN